VRNFFTNTTNQPELFLSPPALEIDPKFDDYLTTLTEGVAERWAKARKQTAYLTQVQQTGVNAAATTDLLARVKAEVESLERVDTEVEKVRKVLAYGCEPTTPPQTWWCGYLEDPKGRYANETWPSLNLKQATPGERVTASTFAVYLSYGQGTPLEYTSSLIFSSAVPVEVLNAYAATKGLFEGVRVYSPDPADFKQLANPIPHDPVLIGRLFVAGRTHYFEIARWDIDSDLAELFSR